WLVSKALSFKASRRARAMVFASRKSRMRAPPHWRTEEIGACLADPFANGEGGKNRYVHHEGAGGGCINPAIMLGTTALRVKLKRSAKPANPQSAPVRRLRVILIALRGVFIPFDAGAGLVRPLQHTVDERERLDDNRVGPVLPFEPMGGLGDAHEMRGKFRIEMRRHGNAGRTGDGGCAQPA